MVGTFFRKAAAQWKKVENETVTKVETPVPTGASRTLSVSLRSGQVASLEALGGILHPMPALLQNVLPLQLLLLLPPLLLLLEGPDGSRAFYTD